MEEILTELRGLLPTALLPIAVTLGLSFLIGLQREERTREAGTYAFGGVRTFPALGLSGYLLARLTDGHILPLSAGLLVVGAILVLSYRNKLAQHPESGATTEISGLFTFLLGAYVAAEAGSGGDYWEATALTVILVILLALKNALERLARRIPPDEIYTFARFLLLAAVILPIVPDRDFTRFALNPFHIWLVVVVISGLSYFAYVANKLFGARKGTLLSSMLGGLYASTATTVVLARQSKVADDPWLLPGATLMASGMVYVRIPILLGLFSPPLAKALLPVCAALAVAALGGGFLIARRGGKKKAGETANHNPLGLGEAFLLAGLFTFMSVGGKALLAHVGAGALFVLAALSGVIDIDPFILSVTGMSQSLATGTAAAAILAAVASNNVLKAAYALVLGSKATGRRAAAMLTVLSLLTGLGVLLHAP